MNSKLSGYGIDVKGSGDVYKLPAGPMALALGVQAGKENADPELRSAAGRRAT